MTRILESSDEAHFYVFKKILTLASPIFAARFSALPPPHQKFHDVRILRLVPFPDPSTIFDLALRHIYPVRTPKTDTFHNASVLAEFVRKYKVAREALDNFIAGYLTDSVERDPVGIYATPLQMDTRTLGHKLLGHV